MNTQIIPDTNLEDAIRKEINKDSGAITVADLSNMTNLFAAGKRIICLDGLEHCSKLRALDISYNNISDISPVKNMKKLEYLNCSHNSISDISPIENLVNIFYLGLGYNRVTDCSYVKHLDKLELLDVVSNDIEISPIPYINIHTTELYLKDDYIENLLLLETFGEVDIEEEFTSVLEGLDGFVETVEEDEFTEWTRPVR